MNLQIGIVIVLACCLLGCYIAACNSALNSFSRKRLADVLANRGRLERLDPFLERLPKLLLITGALRAFIGLFVVLAVLYFIEINFENFFQAVFDSWATLVTSGVAFLAAGSLVSIFIVAIPTSWARYHREALLARSLPLFTLLPRLVPIASVLHLFDPIVRRISGADLTNENGHELTDKVLSVVEDHDSEAKVDQVQKEMLEEVIELPATSAGEIMTPRTDVLGIEISWSLQQVKREIMDKGHSRIPVYEESLDHIVGILYAKDLIPFVGNGEAFDLRSVLREAFMVPESKSVRELLAEFKARKVHLAIVLDEYGGTAGLVTIEDILEEIVGEIQDEYELTDQPPRIDELDSTTSEVDGRMHIDDLNDALNVELPEDKDYDTVGGFVFSQLGHIPKVGESFDFVNLRVTVTDAGRTKVNRVKFQRLAPSEGRHNGNSS